MTIPNEAIEAAAIAAMNRDRRTYDDGLRRAAEIARTLPTLESHVLGVGSQYPTIHGEKIADAILSELGHPPQPSREELLTALEELASAADDVGVRYFDTHKLQTATERARAIIAQADNAGKPEGEKE